MNKAVSRKNPDSYIYAVYTQHDDVIKWKHFPRFVRGIHRSPVNSPHKGQWRGASMFSLIFAWINAWVNNGEAGDLRRYRAHYDVSVMEIRCTISLTGSVYRIINTLSYRYLPVSLARSTPNSTSTNSYVCSSAKATRLWKHSQHFAVDIINCISLEF